MLPYQNIEEAEEALSRALSLAEKLWFKYSAQKPDHILHYHNIIFLMLFYTLAPLPYVFIGLGGFKNIDKYKIQPKVKDSFSNMFKCYKDVMQTFLLVVGPLQVISYSTVQWIGIRTSLPLPSLSQVFPQIVVYFVVEDFSNYWIHRMLHCKWAYEKIHRVHHEYTAPIGLAAPYAHWAEIMILGLPSFLGPTLVPCHIATYWLWFILRQLEAIETHSGYMFPWSPTKCIPFYGGAEYHDYHHYVGELSNGNFASVFTYCDYIYGTHKRWGRPAEGWLKCNFDGAWSHNGNRGGFGVVIRDHLGQFVAAAAGPVNPAYSALYVEFVAARSAIVLMKRLNMEAMKMHIEGDASLVLSAMKGQGEDCSVLGPIINDLRHYLQEWAPVHISHIPREGNSVAHRLARLGTASPREVVWFEDPPELIRDSIVEESL